MKHRDSVTTLLLALFVPFYSLYWLYQNNLGLRSRNIKMPSNFMLFAPMIIAFSLWILSFVLQIILLAASGSSDGAAAGVAIFSFFIGLLLIGGYIAAVVMICMYYHRFSQGAVQLIGHDMTPGVYTLLFVFIAPVPIYLMQEKFNALLSQEYYQQYPPQAPQAPTPPAPVA